MLAPFKRIKLYPLQKNINGVLLWRKITLKRSEINETRIKRLVRLRAIDLKNIVSEKDRVAFVLHSFGLFPTLGAGKSQLRRLLIPCYRWDCERVRADELKESSFESTPRNDESEQWPPPSSCLRRSRHTPWNRVFQNRVSRFLSAVQKIVSTADIESIFSASRNNRIPNGILPLPFVVVFFLRPFLRRFFRPTDHEFRFGFWINRIRFLERAMITRRHENLR